MPDRKHHRRSIRLAAYDYAQEGAYFVTICTQGRACLFGDVIDGVMRPNDAGRLMREQWIALARLFNGLTANEVVVMPNHVHGIIQIHRQATANVGPPVEGAPAEEPHSGLPVSLGRIVGAFKSCSTNAYITGVSTMRWPPFRGRLWQRNYYEHVIRDEKSFARIRQYMQDNPLQWSMDPENPLSQLYRRGAP